MMTKIERSVSILVVIACLFVLPSCRREIWEYKKEEGLENFTGKGSDLELDYYLLPDHEYMADVNNSSPGSFIKRFDYVDGNYWVHVYGGIFDPVYMENYFVYMQYDNEIYEDAKTYAVENLILSEEPFQEYNGYSFYLNYTSRREAREHFTPNFSNPVYPYEFLVFSYNDELNILAFFGMYACGKSLESEIDAVADDWPAFLEKYYGEWYSFS